MAKPARWVIDPIDAGPDGVKAGEAFDRLFLVGATRFAKAAYPDDAELREAMIASFRNAFICGWMGGRRLS
jgi:hypothetical protein